MNPCDGYTGCTAFSHDPRCSRAFYLGEEPYVDHDAIASLRRKLTGHAEGEGDVTFTRTDGSTFTIEDVRIDSVGPSAESKGVIGVEFYNSNRVVHVPFVQSWEFNYR